MAKNSLVMMIVLVVLAAVASFLLQQEEEQPAPLTSPLTKIDFGSLKSLTCTTKAHGSWTIRAHGLDVEFVAPGVAGGVPVAVNRNMYGRVVGFLQDARPSGSRRVADLKLAEWGLEPPNIELSIEDGSGIHVFEIGQPDLNQEILIRAKGDEYAFSFPARVVADLSREPLWFRDPRMCDIPSHLAERFDFQRRNGEKFALVKTATQWYVELGDGERRRAKSSLVDQVTVALSAARGRPLKASDAEKKLDTPEIVVKISGMTKEVKKKVMTLERDRILARRSDEPDVRKLDPEVLRFLDIHASDLEDTHLIGIDPNELAAISILHPEGRPLRLVLENRFWTLKFGTNLSWLVDGTEMRSFQSALLSIQTKARHKISEARTAEYQLEFGFQPELELPSVLVSFSKPDDDGNRFVWRSDENVEYTVGPEVTDLLKTRYWDVMAHYVCVGAAAQINDIVITEKNGVAWRVTRSEREGHWVLTSKLVDGVQAKDFKEFEFPEDFMTGLLNLLSQVSVESFLGEQDPAKIAKDFAAPTYEIHWTHKERTPIAGVDSWAPRHLDEKYLIVGNHVDDVHLLGRSSEFPALIFTIPGTSLLPVEDVLRNIKK